MPEQPQIPYPNRQIPKQFKRAPKRVLQRLAQISPERAGLYPSTLQSLITGQAPMEAPQRLPGMSPTTGTAMSQLALNPAPTPIPAGPIGSTGQPPINQPRFLGSFNAGSALPAPAPMQPAPWAPPVAPAASAPAAATGAGPLNAKALLEKARGGLSRPFGGTGVPTWGAGLAALVAPNAIAPLTPNNPAGNAIDQQLRAMGTGAGLGAIGGPMGAAIGAGVGSELNTLSNVAGGDRSLAERAAIFGASRIPGVGMIAAPLIASMSEEGPNIAPGIEKIKGNMDYVLASTKNFFEGIQTMGVPKTDAKALKLMYEQMMATAPTGKFDRATHDAALQQLLPMAMEMLGVAKEQEGVLAAEERQYERQQETIGGLEDYLTQVAAQEQRMAQQWMDQQQANYQAAMQQQLQFAADAQKFSAGYLAPFQQRLQDSAANQAAFLQAQGQTNPAQAGLYNELAQMGQFNADQSVAAQAAFGQAMPLAIYQQQINALSPPNWSQYQPQPSRMQDLLMQAYMGALG